MSNQPAFRIGILGAGLGSRLKSEAGAKPLAKLGSQSLLELLVARLARANLRETTCALREELVPPAARASLPQLPGLQYIFVNTESSLHTLAELIRAMGASAGPILFTMADTVMLPDDFQRFVAFCSQLAPQENAVLLTSFVDDEKPLWVKLDAAGRAVQFGSEPTHHVTSGMYFLQPEAMDLALREVETGTHKMRNFLSKLAETGSCIKTFVVQKTIDVDHPSDLEKAALFLHGR